MGRNARRLRLMRYERWLARNHPNSAVLPCMWREHNRRVREDRRRGERWLRAHLESVRAGERDGVL